MPFDCSAPRRPMTAAAALLAYDKACHTGDLEQLAEAAHGLAEALRPKPKAPKGDKTPAELIAAALAPVLAVIERRSSIPSTTWVHFRCDGERLTMSGTDLDMQATAVAPAFGLQPFALCLPVDAVAAAFRKARGDVSLSVEALEPDAKSDQIGFAVLEIAGVRSRIPAYKPERFPALDVPAFGFLARLAGESMAAALRPVRLAVSSEETRYYLNGVFLHLARETEDGPETLRLVATDGHRLAQTDLPDLERIGDMPTLEGTAQPGAIVPLKALDWLLKYAGAGEVTAELCEKKARFTVGGLSLVTRLIEGSYPDVQRVIPRDPGEAVFTLGQAGAAAIQRLAANSKERSRSIRLEVSGGVVRGSLRNMEGGLFTAEIPADDVHGEGEIGFNSAYLLDALAYGAGRFHVVDPAMPCRVTYDDPGRLAVIMPLRV